MLVLTKNVACGIPLHLMLDVGEVVTCYGKMNVWLTCGYAGVGKLSQSSALDNLIVVLARVNKYTDDNRKYEGETLLPRNS